MPLLAVAAAIGTRVLWERDGRRLNGRFGVLQRLGDGAGGVASTAAEQLRRVPWLRDALAALRPRGGRAWGHTPGDEGRRPRQRRKLTPSESAGRAAVLRAAKVRTLCAIGCGLDTSLQLVAPWKGHLRRRTDVK